MVQVSSQYSKTMRFFIRKKNIVIVSAILILLFTIALLWLTSPFPSPNEDVLSNPNYYIAHATGAIDGRRYLNCEEALMQALDNGYKYVEIDLGLTNDSVLVCLHSWALFNKLTSNTLTTNVGQPLSLEEFASRKIAGKYTPMSLERVIEISKRHPFTIVTDKLSDAEMLNRFIPHDIRSHVMVEAFSISDYYNLKREGYVPMMSLYTFNYPDIKAFFTHDPLQKQEHIDWICVHSSSNMGSLRMAKRLFNCKVALYTSNSPMFFKEHLGKEIDFIYTDNWNPQTKTNNDSINITTY